MCNLFFGRDHMVQRMASRVARKSGLRYPDPATFPWFWFHLPCKRPKSDLTRGTCPWFWFHLGAVDKMTRRSADIGGLEGLRCRTDSPTRRRSVDFVDSEAKQHRFDRFGYPKGTAIRPIHQARCGTRVRAGRPTTRIYLSHAAVPGGQSL